MNITAETRHNSSDYVVVCVDGPNADNQAAAWGAWEPTDPRLQLAAVVVSGTAVDYRPDAPLGSRDDRISAEVQELHTARMAGLFARAGSDVPVFIGKPVAETGITTPIPHSAHVRHEEYDLFGDNTGLGQRRIAGDFNDALAHIAALDGTVHVVIGGPFTKVPSYIEHPGIAPKLGLLAAQTGYEFSERKIYSKLAFNHEVDELASLQTFLQYPGAMFSVPSEITRAPEATFQSAEELVRYGIHRELGDIFTQHRARAEERHKEQQREREAQGQSFRPYPALSIHDLQAVMALRQALGIDEDIFRFAPVDIDHAIGNMIRASNGVITAEKAYELGWRGGRQTTGGQLPDRLVVVEQNTERYKRLAMHLLQPKQGSYSRGQE